MKKTVKKHKVRRDKKKQQMTIMTMRVPLKTVATARRTTKKKIMMKTMMTVAMTRMTVMIVMKRTIAVVKRRSLTGSKRS